MWSAVELFLNSALLWIFFEVACILSVNAFYISVPWFVWGALIVTAVLWFIRIPQPDSSIVKEVLGEDLLSVKKDDLTRETREQNCMRVVAHRGGGFDYPENSLAAFRNCKEKGCNVVEFDVSLTKDNIPIIFHDVTIERLTGHVGVVKEMTWDQLKELDITHNHPLRNKFVNGAKIALFDDAIEECLRNGQRMIIDIKEKGLEIVQIIIDAFKKNPDLYRKAIVSSFNPLIIYMIRKKESRIISSLAWRPRFFSTITYKGLDGPSTGRFRNPFKNILATALDIIHDWALHRFTYYILGISAILLHKDAVNPEVVRWWHVRGVRVIIWIVNLPSEKLHYSRVLKVPYLTDSLLSEEIP
ncbi:glycerophosphodiester phosphodiesterase 1 [Belonocnema kinseyi]|uniref:glycerophosphodiester phosphodiesterase 1 n=1 Tax=Belonocnema kinseyi TaxID=2817044 RepID=UPI00143DEBBF|nr:glycerophosphodiester phosphodiesterase 1 [Belonocnema kinseyi]